MPVDTTKFPGKPFYFLGVKMNAVGLVGYIIVFVGIGLCIYGALKNEVTTKSEKKEKDYGFLVMTGMK